MKKLILFLVTLLASNSMKADEGMWTLYNLPTAVFETMKSEGFELTYDQLYNGDEALKNCVVNFGGFCVHQPPLRLRGHPQSLYR